MHQIAIVTDKTHVYALAKVFAEFTHLSPIKVKVFRSAADGVSWLRDEDRDGSS